MMQFFKTDVRTKYINVVTSKGDTI